jgi:hypothetical protein
MTTNVANQLAPNQFGKRRSIELFQHTLTANKASVLGCDVRRPPFKYAAGIAPEGPDIMKNEQLTLCQPRRIITLSLRQARMILLVSYVAFVMTLAAAIFCVSEGLLPLLE